MIWYIIDRSLDVIVMIIMAAMSVIVATNVLFRFVLNYSLYWGDELAQVLLVWLTFLGAAIATRERTHYKFTSLLDTVKGTVRHRLKIFSDLLYILIILILMYYNIKVCIYIQSWIMPALEISRALVYGAVTVGCFFMLLYAFRHLKVDLKRQP